jgi:HAD superfamily phosphoserine phosphatase-like hydrolase
MQNEPTLIELGLVFLRTVAELSGGTPGVGVSFREIQEQLSLSDEVADLCCEFWTEQGVITWSSLGHVALTHLGAAKVPRLLGDNGGTPSGPSVSVSVIIPALNEAGTVHSVIRSVRRDPSVCEVIVVDDGSIDGTPEAAANAGATVVMSSLLGKGASMQDGIGLAKGEVVLFVDGDLREVCMNFVQLMVGPIASGEADFVKAGFTLDAGRVTVLTARPLLNVFFPELSIFEQPLGGIVAATRSLLKNIQLETDYGADVGLLIDAALRGARIQEVDIGRIDHASQPLEALGSMAKQVTRVIIDRAWRHGRLSINRVREEQELDRVAAARLSRATMGSKGGQRFALFDMDGVLLDGRFVEAVAKKVGVEGDLARLLDNALVADGERSRLIASLFVGVYADTFEEIARSIPLVEGARETVIALRKAGYRVGIVTDSYQIAAETVRRRVFADFSIGHIMRFRGGRSTGELTLSPWMLDHGGCPDHVCCKSNVLRNLRQVADLVPEQTIAVGDGENDVCMLEEAGISVAFRPRSASVELAAKHVVYRSLMDVVSVANEEAQLGAFVARNRRTAKLCLGA